MKKKYIFTLALALLLAGCGQVEEKARPAYNGEAAPSTQALAESEETKADISETKESAVTETEAAKTTTSAEANTHEATETETAIATYQEILNFTEQESFAAPEAAETEAPTETAAPLSTEGIETAESIGEVTSVTKGSEETSNDICQIFATSRIDWYNDGKDLADGIWDKLGQDHSAVITNTDELFAYLTPLYNEGVITKYLDEYDDAFFADNMLIVNTIYQGAGWGAKYCIDTVDFVDKVQITVKSSRDEVEPEVMSVCLAQLAVEKSWVENKPVSWNIE